MEGKVTRIQYVPVVIIICITTDFMYWRNRILPVARALQGKLEVVMSDEVEYIAELDELGLKDLGQDLAVALWSGKKEKYVMKDDFDEDSLNEFTEVKSSYTSCITCR